MAQRDEADERMRRIKALLRRPQVRIGVLLVGVLLAGAAAFGVVQAGAPSGIEIARVGDTAAGAGSGSADADDADAAADAGGDGGTAGGKAADEGAYIVVDVSGAVAQPSVVELAEGSRVQDAIDAAGGLAPDADVSTVNRAAVLADGQKVAIPRIGEALTAGASGDGVAAATGAATGGSATATGSSALVNINTADETALDGLPGVGPSTAQAIVEDRTSNGPFASIEDLMRVSGIGEKKFEKLKSSICV